MLPLLPSTDSINPSSQYTAADIDCQSADSSKQTKIRFQTTSMSDPNLGKPGGGDQRKEGGQVMMGKPIFGTSELSRQVGAEGQTRHVSLDKGTSPLKRSWASVLGGNLSSRDNKNVLEVILEKDTRGGFVVTDDECANMMRRLGLDQRPRIHVEEVQICPQGRGVIYITLKKEVDITRFCRYDVFDVTKSGTRSVLVKPAVKKEVVVTAKGIHPNTKEGVVIDYLEKFGIVCADKVVYWIHGEGPLQGLRNGDRIYKIEIKPGFNLGSYHVIDAQKVTIRYTGQLQTCARC